MASTVTAGARIYKLRFEQRAVDANGDRLGPWEPRLTTRADILWLRGSEAVQAQRLQGLQPAVITILASSAAKDIRSGWRAVDANILNPGPGDYFAIHGATLTKDRSHVEVLAERGAEV